MSTLLERELIRHIPHEEVNGIGNMVKITFEFSSIDFGNGARPAIWEIHTFDSLQSRYLIAFHAVCDSWDKES
jgi:hypothetical protein